MSLKCTLTVWEAFHKRGQSTVIGGATSPAGILNNDGKSGIHIKGRGRRPPRLTETIMRRVLVIAASSLALAACSGSDFPKFDMPKFDMPSMPSMASTPATSTLEFESEPSGAEVRTSTGQTCRTPCALSVAASDFTATFSAPGYQPMTVPVRMVSSGDGRDPMTGQSQPPRLSPNPVYAELVVAPPVRRPAPATANPNPTPKKKKTAKPKPAPAASASEPMTAAPSAPPAAPWPMPAPAR
jgi:hypothetical protein